MAEEDISVSTIDDLSKVAHDHDRTRKLSEYSPTNMPLSAAEINEDEAKDVEHTGWAPRTTENIGDLKPLPENGPPPPQK
jgi:hypothetical protein